MPLAHPPGHAQADFGEADAIIAGVKRRAHFFAMDLPHSDACFVAAYPAAATEAWLDGHNGAFAFFGGIPQSILYDNDKCLVSRILPDRARGNERERSAGFNPIICSRIDMAAPARAMIRARWEGLVGYARPELHGSHPPVCGAGTPSTLTWNINVGDGKATSCAAIARPSASGSDATGRS